MRVHKFIFYILTITVLIAGAQGSIAQKTKIQPFTSPSDLFTNINARLTVEVDKSGMATFNGTGFGAFEPVSMNVQTASNGVLPGVFLAQWTVFADGSGAIGASWQIANLAGSYTLTAYGVKSAQAASTKFYGPAVVNAGASNLDQCANGQLGAPVICSGLAWENGNLNNNKAHYFEGESVSYRIRFTGLDTSVDHWVIIEWDTTEGGHHAIDYLTSYDFSESGAEPCSGAGPIDICDSTNFDTEAIPIDTWVTAGFNGIAGDADDIIQAPGVFNIFDGQITGVSAYTRTGTYTGKSTTSIRIDFTATTSTPVLAWGGHISTRHDWGGNNSAVAIDGAPFHMRVVELDGSGGNQDRSLSSSAAIFPADITIIKDAQPNVYFPFTFTVTGQALTPSTFILDDDGNPAVNYSNVQTFADIVLFGAGNEVIVTESFQGSVFSLADINCMSDPHGGLGTNNNLISIINRNVEITLEEGEKVTCTFVNAVTGPTASEVEINGRVLTAYGRPIYRALLTAINGNTGDIRFVFTNTFGYYRLTGLDAGQTYVVSVAAKSYRFEPGEIVISPTDNISGLNFIASP